MPACLSGLLGNTFGDPVNEVGEIAELTLLMNILSGGSGSLLGNPCYLNTGGQVWGPGGGGEETGWRC